MKKNFEANGVERLRPYGKRVLIRKEESDGKTEGGIYIPTKPDDLEDRGFVVDVGPLVKDICPELKKGDHVIFDRFHLNDLDNPHYKLIDCDFIWGIIEENNEEKVND